MQLLTIDESGRILLPKQVREQLGLNIQDRLSLEVKDGQLILQPLSQEALTDYEEGVLVVKSEFVDSIEITIDNIRDERINELSSW
jgi:AbrB family looped-hinge helix DNA binding protein